MVQFEEGEKVMQVVRRHYFVIIPTILALLVMALAPFLLYKFLMTGFVPLDPTVLKSLSGFATKWSVFAYSTWLLLLWIMFFVEWTDYYLDLWIITNRHIIDIEQKGFFHREVISFRYQQIQDITVETRGILETMLKFGTLHIQTAGENKEILIRNAHYPENARALILKLQEQSKSI